MKRGVRNGVVALLFALVFVAGSVGSVAHAQADVSYASVQKSGEHESGDDDQGLWGLLGLLGLVGLVGLVRRGRRGDQLAGPAAAPPATRSEEW
ncbi:WGxxGxxG family protein [Actinophytocola sp.]|uniref:WGxxGxxG family protein n=1 Tax=Actinophytocola sp. TaxID=1872138 RepID=UPI00389ACB88